MVRLTDFRISNLYSYDTVENQISFSQTNVIVGPNDSGKSNILRTIELAVDSVGTQTLIENSAVYRLGGNPKLEGRFQFSDSEVGLLVDFLGAYPDRSPASIIRVHRFENRTRLLDSMKELHLEITWEPTNATSLWPTHTFSFDHLGLKVHSNSPSGPVFATRKFPLKQGSLDQGQFPTFLDKLASPDQEESAEAHQTLESEGKHFQIPTIYLNNIDNPTVNGPYLDRIMMLCGKGSSRMNNLSFCEVIGSILKKGFFISKGGTIFLRKTRILERRTENGRSMTEEIQSSINYSMPLDQDGWNLSEYLFRLKNSPEPSEREMFTLIQTQLHNLFPTLAVDVVLLPMKDSESGNVNSQVPRLFYPKITFKDFRNAKNFYIDGVGAGVSESLFLLTALLGLKESVVLLDEPAVNLHPLQMKALFHAIESTQNQLVIVTHSSSLIHNILFDRGASLVYVRRPADRSEVKVIDLENEWSETDRYRLSYQIDARIFFARHVLLCEGESDRKFLEMLTVQYDMKLDTHEDVVVGVSGKNNFKKYTNLLEHLGIPFCIVADGDGNAAFPPDLSKRAQEYSSAPHYSIIEVGAFGRGVKGRVFFFESRIEEFLKSLDGDRYEEATKDSDKSKPSLTYAIAKGLTPKQLDGLESSLKPILEHAFETAKRANNLET